MKNNKISLIYSLLILFLLLLSCSDNNSQYLGKWKPSEFVEYSADAQKKVTKAPTSEGKFEFFKDKTLLVVGMMGGGGSGKWTVLEDGRAKIDLDLGLGHMIMFGSIKGDTLTITMPDKKVDIIFKKIN